MEPSGRREAKGFSLGRTSVNGSRRSRGRRPSTYKVYFKELSVARSKVLPGSAGSPEASFVEEDGFAVGIPVLSINAESGARRNDDVLDIHEGARQAIRLEGQAPFSERRQIDALVDRERNGLIGGDVVGRAQPALLNHERAVGRCAERNDSSFARRHRAVRVECRGRQRDLPGEEDHRIANAWSCRGQRFKRSDDLHRAENGPENRILRRLRKSVLDACRKLPRAAVLGVVRQGHRVAENGLWKFGQGLPPSGFWVKTVGRAPEGARPRSTGLLVSA